MKLTVHLFTTDALSFGDALTLPGRGTPDIVCLLPRTELDFSCALAVRAQDGEPGPEELAEHFTLAGTGGADSALLAEVDGRLFALTFGRGAELLEPALLEPEFEGKAIPFPLAGLGHQLSALLGHYDDPLHRAEVPFSAERA
ncbi:MULTISPECIES: hypothetical protein [unclassified Crossiella]|uniref:hypothetical protein n=1 Tax=unclassified Crossiella TaxID=2620835 RepID=UPI001FFEFAF7|nr:MULTISPECIES: hypothetical protein [unclassified Crossiella]MCK2237083.1 hypothetical protein [Crossiella sp. S99.2]MCK2250751.1 hypothetical protein [Crossiella sp. S99.1]